MFRILFLNLLLCFFYSNACVARTTTCEPFLGSLSPKHAEPKYSPEKYFQKGQMLINAKQHKQAFLAFGMISHHFPEHILSTQALYYMGACKLKLKQPDLAERYFHQYTQKSDAKHNDDLAKAKLAVATYYAKGHKKHLFGLEGFPKLESSYEDALRLYDEVLMLSPNNDIGAQALYHKALLLRKHNDTDAALKTLKKLSQQFSKHELAAQSFVISSEIYLKLATLEPHHPQHLSLAKANLQQFKRMYPSHPNVDIIQKNVAFIMEKHAKGLLATGKFYEKKRKPKAASIYYSSALAWYPETKSTIKCQKRLSRLSRHI